jgi:dipeptidyl aminopeptidase/acylaminoacyl peptidase
MQARDHRVAVACIALLSCLTACTHPSSKASPVPALIFEHVRLPGYDEERGIRWTGSREEYAAAIADARYVMEQFRYRSDELTVGAYIYHPRTAVRAQPVIIFNRGSFTRPTGFAGEILVMAHRYAQAGFIVVAPHYRGSNGWQGRDELGGADLHDLTNIVPEIARIPGADPTHLFLAGQSRGGAMVYMALRDGFPAKAAAVWGAFTDLEPLIAPGGPQAKHVNLVWPDIDMNRRAIIESRSALYWAERISAPILIMHGGADEDIPLDQSQRMDVELTRLGKEHKLLVFDDQQHFIGGRGAERDAATIEWFRSFMGTSR